MRIPSKALAPDSASASSPTGSSRSAARNASRKASGRVHRDAAAMPGDVLAMLVVFTRLPLPQPVDFSTLRLARAHWATPVVGLIVGLVTAAALGAAFAVGLPAYAAAFVAAGAGVLITGAMQEDGLADCADGLGGGQDAESKLQIMRDSRLGAFGASALIMALGLRVALYAPLALVGWTGLLAVVGAAAASRALVPGAMWLSNPVKSDGLGAMVGRPPWESVVAASVLGLACALAGAWVLPGLLAIAVAAAAAFAVIVLAQYQIGGYTGDVLAACQQAAELAFLATVVAALTW